MSDEQVSGNPPVMWTSTPTLIHDAANLVILTCQLAENRRRPPPGPFLDAPASLRVVPPPPQPS